MMAKKRVAIAVVLGCTAMAWCVGGTGVLAQTFRTKQVVDIRRFAGSWYELARTPNQFQDTRKRKGGKVYSPCYNVTTEFALQDTEKLRLQNFCLRKAPQGDVIRETLAGLAVVTDEPANRKLKITFGSAPLRMLQNVFAGGGKNYWIYCIGPINKHGRYDWAVTGGPKRRFVFLLTRDRTVSSRTKSQILSCARREGIPVDELMYLQR